MSRTVAMLGIALFAVVMASSFYRAVVSAPGTFAIVVLGGGALMAILTLRGKGDWNPSSKNYPPYRTMVGIFLASLLISWVIGSKPATLTSCPPSMGRWC